MLWLFDVHASLFKSWDVVWYEQEEDAYHLHVSARLRDDSRLELRDYLFADGTRKYAYHWMEPDGSLRRRWDNAPHWPEIAAHPNHVHVAHEKEPTSSTITNLEDLMQFLEDWYAPTAGAYDA
jgi:hypothetical protein